MAIHKHKIKIAVLGILLIIIAMASLLYYKSNKTKIHLEATSNNAIILRSSDSDTIEINSITINDSLNIFDKTSIRDDNKNVPPPNYKCKEHIEQIMDDSHFQYAQTTYYHDIKSKIAPKKKMHIDITKSFNSSCNVFICVRTTKVEINTNKGTATFRPKTKESLFRKNGYTYYDLNKKNENGNSYFIIE